MKITNILIILGFLMCFLYAFSYIQFIDGNKNDSAIESKNEIVKSSQKEIKSVKTEKNISSKDEKETYLIKSDGEKIFLCVLKGETIVKVINESDIPPSLDESDIKKLKDGIYTDNYEKSYLYFESYLS